MTAELDEMSRITRELNRRLLARKVSRKTHNQNAHLRASAVEVGLLAHDVEYWIVGSPMRVEVLRLQEAEAGGEFPAGWVASSHLAGMAEALNGYVAFPKRHCPVRMPSQFTHDTPLLDFIPVHGGITYMVKDQTAAVFGFDTAHFDSEVFPREDKLWIAAQCRILYRGLLRARELERDFRRASSDTKRLALLQEVHDLSDQSLSVPAMMRLMAGNI